MSKKGKSLIGKLFGKKSDCGCCCKPNFVSVREITVKGSVVEVIALNEIFEDYYNSGFRSETIDGEALILDLKKSNVISDSSRDEYKEAILKEYENYCKEKNGGVL